MSRGPVREHNEDLIRYDSNYAYFALKKKQKTTPSSRLTDLRGLDFLSEPVPSKDNASSRVRAGM